MGTSKKQKPRIALVLSGGGAGAASHVGVLKTLEKAGIRPDLIVGTSMGSIIGSCYAAGHSPEAIEAMIKQITWKDIAPVSLPRLMGLIPLSNIQKVYQRHSQVRDFSELKIPMAITTTSLKTGKQVVLTEGNLIDAIQAACAIPGIFTPFEKNGELFVDGAISCNIPVNVARDMGADIVIVSDALSGWVTPEQVSNAMHVVAQSMITLIQAASDRTALEADFYIQTQHPESTISNFSLTPTLIQMGENNTRALIPNILRKIDKFSLHTPKVLAFRRKPLRLMTAQN